MHTFTVRDIRLEREGTGEEEKTFVVLDVENGRTNTGMTYRMDTDRIDIDFDQRPPEIDSLMSLFMPGPPLLTTTIKVQCNSITTSISDWSKDQSNG